MAQSTEEQVVSTTFLRASIVLESLTVDVQLPADYPVESIVYEVLRYLNVSLIEQGYATDWLTDADAEWTLERLGRRQLESERSLAEQGVEDGERLWLVKNARNEKYPALVDDLAEGVVQGQEEFPEWSYGVDAVKFASVALGALGAVVSLAAVYLIGWSPSLASAWRWEAVAVIGGLAALYTVLSVIVLNGKSSVLGASLLSAGYVSTAVAAFLALPRPPGMWHMAVVGSAVLVYAAAMTSLARGPVRIHSGAITAGVIVTSIALFNYVYLSPPSVVAAQLVTLGYIFTLPFIVKVSMVAGRIETPYVPAAGEALTKDEVSLADLNRGAASAEVIESAASQKEKNYAAHQYFVGIILGALPMVVFGSAMVGFFPSDRPWVAFALVMCVAASTMFNGRYQIDRDAHTTLLVGACLTVAAYVAALSVSGAYRNLPQIAAAAGIAVVVIVVGSLWTLSQKSINTPTVRRIFELLEYPFYATPVLTLIWLMDVWMKIRNR
ncbi:MAG: type VII secretion integral membrane protein EccD [Spirochaetes bacterium]|nr:MAG: type VII secretion integral membrane protein EccD [Spirochaetota bacterium]